MHIDDKVGKVVAGDLVRSRNNVVVNPFPGGQEIVNIAHNAATHFSYSTRHTKLREFSKMVPGGAPEIRLKNDKCTTRVSARLGMAHSVLRMHKPLRLYGVSYPKTPVAKLTDARFETLAEIEGLMRISGSVCVLDQSEFIFVHALGHPLHERMLAKFRSATVDVVDLPRVSAAPIMPRKAKNTSEFSEVGLEAMRRGALEVERRHNGNKTEFLNGKRTLIALDEQLATMIDPRTMALKHLPASDRKERRRTSSLGSSRRPTSSTRARRRYSTILPLLLWSRSTTRDRRTTRWPSAPSTPARPVETMRDGRATRRTPLLSPGYLRRRSRPLLRRSTGACSSTSTTRTTGSACLRWTGTRSSPRRSFPTATSTSSTI